MREWTGNVLFLRQSAGDLWQGYSEGHFEYSIGRYGGGGCCWSVRIASGARYERVSSLGSIGDSFYRMEELKKKSFHRR